MNKLGGLLIFSAFLCATSLEEIQSETSRDPKFWKIGVVRFKNDPCTSNEGFDGICYTKSECMYGNGIGSGSCANNFGTCCVFQVTCGNTSIHNNTYFVNPGFPNTYSGSSTCTITIQKCFPNICQVRLDFLNLNLAQPDGNGNCNTDSLLITGGASNIPVICGENSGEHVYVNFNGNNSITLSISTSGGAFPRAWNIKVTQLACDCPSLAPTGCLMYYTGVTGTVNSFNYGTTLSGALVINPMGMTRPGTRQLANENYGVCVQMQAGYCSIQWSQGPDDVSFTVSGNTALDAVPPPGLPDNGMMGTDCTTDFVVIPDPSSPAGVPIGSDRFCGDQFPTLVTSSKPFVMTVVTNGDDTTDVANRGFSLNYQQIPCAPTPGFLVMP